MKKNKGFTFIELMVVIIIIGIMTAVTAPNFLIYIQGFKLRSVTYEIYGRINYMRVNAVKLREPLDIQFMGNWYKFWDRDIRSGAWGYDPRIVQEGIVVSGDTIRFNTRGMLRDPQTKTVSICNTERCMGVQVNPVGSSRIVELDPPGGA